MTIIINLPPAHGHVGCLFLIFCIYFIALSIILRALSLCIFTKISRSTINFKTENGSRLITKYYAFTIRVDQVNFLREKFGVSAYSRISTVIYILIIKSRTSVIIQCFIASAPCCIHGQRIITFISN